MMMRLKNYFLLVSLALFSSVALAQSSPMEMLQSTSDQMISALRANKASLKSNPGTVYRIVNQILVPHVDLDTMSRLVLGRTAWQQASPDLRARFQKEFTRLVIRTYSSALASYTNQTINFMPMRSGSEGRSRVQVQSQILREDGPPIALNYRLQSVNGEWLIYDFIIEGVSMVESFRSQFADDLSTEGLEQLVTKMSRHNSGS